MRVGYLVMGVELAVPTWPELVHHQPWELIRGTAVTMLMAMSVLALPGLWVLVIIAVIHWPHVIRQFVLAPRERWR
jgi:hypothetical protein